MPFGLVRTARRRLRHPDEGFTILEVVASLGIIAVALAALTTVFWSGLRTAGISSVRSRATAVATRETEAIRAVPYAKIGFYSNQFAGTPPTGTVILGATAPADVRIQPTGTLTVGPKTYTISRSITNANATDGSTTYTNAYKKTTVTVTWTDDAGAHTVTQHSMIYPGGLGPQNSTTSSTPSTPAAPPAQPGGVAVGNVPAPAAHTSLNVTWAAPSSGGPVSYYVVERATNNGFTQDFVPSGQQPATSTSFQATPLTASTTYYFRVVAYGPGGSAVSLPANGTTAAEPPAPPCTVSSLGVTEVDSPRSTTKTYLRSNGKMSTDLSISITTTNVCSGTLFRVRSYRTSPSTVDQGMPVTPGPLSQTNRTAVADTSNDRDWAVGPHTFEVVDGSGSPLSPSVIKTFLVCSATSSPSTNPNQC